MLETLNGPHRSHNSTLQEPSRRVGARSAFTSYYWEPSDTASDPGERAAASVGRILRELLAARSAK